MHTVPKSDKRNWYVLMTRPKAEKQISQRLTENNIEHYLPLHRKLRTWHDRKKWVEMPLFNSYIFVLTEERLRSKVFEVGGLIKYVSIAGQVSILRSSEIDRIKRLCSYLGEIEIEENKLKIGEEVEITTGHFSGIRGHILSTGDSYKFRISIPGLGSSATVEIDKDHVQKAV